MDKRLYGDYPVELTVKPEGPNSGDYRVVRGGSFIDPPELLRSALRVDDRIEFWDPNRGFRCVRVPPQL